MSYQFAWGRSNRKILQYRHQNITHTGITSGGTWFPIHCFLYCCCEQWDICVELAPGSFYEFLIDGFYNDNCSNENDKLWIVFSSETPVILRCTLPCFLFHGRIRMYHAFWHSLVIGAPLVQSMYDEKVGRHILWRSGSVQKYCPLNCIYSSNKNNSFTDT